MKGRCWMWNCRWARINFRIFLNASKIDKQQGVEVTSGLIVTPPAFLGQSFTHLPGLKRISCSMRNCYGTECEFLNRF